MAAGHTIAVIAIAIVIAVLLSAGIAAAYWKSTGTGTGSATAGTAASVSLAPGTVGTQLFPGGTADVATLVTNPNSYAVVLSGLTAGTITSTSATCDANGHQVTFIAPSSYPTSTYRVPARAGVSGGPAALAITISGGASMGINSDNACQAKTFTIPLTGVATATS